MIACTLCGIPIPDGEPKIPVPGAVICQTCNGWCDEADLTEDDREEPLVAHYKRTPEPDRTGDLERAL